MFETFLCMLVVRTVKICLCQSNVCMLSIWVKHTRFYWRRCMDELSLTIYLFLSLKRKSIYDFASATEGAKHEDFKWTGTSIDALWTVQQIGEGRGWGQEIAEENQRLVWFFLLFFLKIKSKEGRTWNFDMRMTNTT